MTAPGYGEPPRQLSTGREPAVELLIAEDVLLLLLDDEKGTIAGESMLYYTLGGAMLVELALAGRARFEPVQSLFKGGTVHAVPGESSGDPLLERAWEALAQKDSWAPQVALITLSKDLRELLTDRLVERGLVERRSKKFLGFIPSTTWPEVDARHEADLRDRITLALRGGVPDPRTAVVISLVHASKQWQVLKVEDMSGSDLRRRATEIAEGNWGAGAVQQTIDTAIAGVIAATTTAIMAVVVTSSTT